MQSVPVRLKVLQTGLKAAADTLLLLLQPLGIVLGLFVLHQLLFWANSDPVRSFGVARGLVEGTEFVWDTLGSLWNLLGEAANSAVIPLWNSISFYIFEPGISLVIEVFALVFTRKSFQGVVSEEQLPYKGFYCNSLDSASMAFCGRYQAYEARLEAGNSGVKDGSLTFGTATARRLSELAGGEFVTPSFDGQELVGALDGMATQGIVMGASGADAFFAVAYEILSTTAVLLFDAIFIIVKAIFEILKMLVKSGIIKTLITFGIDLLLVLAMEVALPALFAVIDAVMCAIQFFNPGDALLSHPQNPSVVFLPPKYALVHRYMGRGPRMCGSYMLPSIKDTFLFT